VQPEDRIIEISLFALLISSSILLNSSPGILTSKSNRFGCSILILSRASDIEVAVEIQKPSIFKKALSILQNSTLSSTIKILFFMTFSCLRQRITSFLCPLQGYHTDVNIWLVLKHFLDLSYLI